MLKRFLAFSGDYDGSGGGMFDFRQDFDVKEEAIEFLLNIMMPKEGLPPEWANVWDAEVRKDAWTFVT